MTLEIWKIIAGAAGALIRDLLTDDRLIIPHRIDKNLSLGFISSLLIGGAAGYLVGTDPATAFMAGYVGKSALENLIYKQTPELPQNAKNEIANPVPLAGDVKGLIEFIARREGVDPGLAVRVARAESGLNPKAKGVNQGGSIDRGLYQINDKWHPGVTDEQAYDPEFATNFFCKAVKAGNLSWWNASKKNWEIT